jgi:hypothetical protein
MAHMSDLYADDIEDEKTSTDATILADIRALIGAGQREGPMLDYKRDVSDKDNWSEAAAAFANTFGGVIVFGVEGERDQPRRLTGFDPQGVEMKTKLVSTLLSRIQPRPVLQVRVVKLDTDPNKQVAILRISEGLRPPYMYSKDQKHRVYIRVGAQKAEADYLQLSALFEKRGKTESQAASFLADFAGPQSELRVTAPRSNQTSPHSYRFLLGPDDDRAAGRLTREVEGQFEECVNRLYEDWERDEVLRGAARTSCFSFREPGSELEPRFGLTLKGAVGFVRHACIQTSYGLFFRGGEFCRDLLRFLVLAASFYERRRYYGGGLLEAVLNIPDRAELSLGVPTINGLGPASLFEPPLRSVPAWCGSTQIRVALHPMTPERLQEYLEAIMNDLARVAGSVLSPSFRASTQPLVDDALKRLRTN